MHQYDPPVLDLADLCDEPVAPEAWALAASQFDGAMRAHGVAYFENCGIPTDLVFTLRQKAYSYFLSGSIDKAETEEYGAEGYTAMGRETVGSSHTKESSLRDIVESLVLFSADSSACPDELRDLVREYKKHMFRLMMLLNRLMAHALDAPEIPHTFDGCEYGCPVKLAHYPASVEGTQGYGAHTDFGGFTILAQDDGDSFPAQGALEVLVDGNWATVPPRKDALLVNAGEVIERWSNGLYKCPLHRVVLKENRTQSRLSIIYFTGPNGNTRVAPLEQCCSNERPPKFEPIIFGEWLLHKLSLTNGNT